jgi:DNA-binding GntR family transcriptional regulator
MEVRFQTKAGFAAEAIRSAIRHGQLAPGERIDMEALTIKLGMSPTPIREALRSLEAEGLIANEPHRGMRVADFSTDVAAELYVLRADLEGLATRLAVPRLTQDDLAALRQLEDRRHQAMARGDMAESSALNHDWHMGLYRPAMETPYLTEFIGRLWNAFPWATSWKIPGRSQRSLDDHKAIMIAAVARDATEASRLMVEHILSSKDPVVQLLEETRLSAHETSRRD